MTRQLRIIHDKEEPMPEIDPSTIPPQESFLAGGSGEHANFLQALDILAHIVSQANVNPVGDGEWIERYNMPVGSIHKAIPFLALFGIVVDTYGYIHKGRSYDRIAAFAQSLYRRRVLMGTNYYAKWRIVEGFRQSPYGLAIEPAMLEMHICKSLVDFQGQVFVSWVAWRHFLLNNRHEVAIVDEYGLDHTTDEFIKDVESTTPIDRRRQWNWLMQHRVLPDGQTTDWLDPDGFTFHSGEFS